MPRYVEMKKLLELEIDDAFQTKQKVRPFPRSMASVTVALLVHRIFEDTVHALKIHTCNRWQGYLPIH